MADFQFTQTGEQLQTIFNEAPTTKQTAEQNATDIQTETTNREGADTVLRNRIAAEETARAVADEALNTLISQLSASLANYYLKTETYSRTQVDEMVAAINTAFSSYYTKTESNALLDTIRQSVTAEVQARTSADNTLQALITQVSNSLVNYYLKTETYSRTEVQQLISAVQRFSYVVAASLPTASADTCGVIYLIPSINPKTKNVKDEFITISETSGSSTTYYWEQIGSTTVDLSGYYTSTQTDAAITTALNTALASYYTKTQIDNMVTTINNAISAETTARENADTALDTRMLFAEKSFGKYAGVSEITLAQAESGKYVNVNGTTTNASGYGISSAFTLKAGDILLVPSAQAVPADVSVVARIVTRTFQKVIGYTYTYREDYPTLPLTATADYNSSLVYTAVYDETGETPTLTGWTIGGTTISQLPATREVTESYYEPLVKQSVSAMPSTGYYIYLCPTAMTVVISGLTATVSGGVCQIVGWGIFKNICSNFVGAPGQAVIAQAFAQMMAEIEGLRAQLANLGETKAVCIDSENLPKVCGESLVVEGAGAPSVVPMFAGQRYHDTTNKKVYEAFSVTNSTSDWVLLN